MEYGKLWDSAIFMANVFNIILHVSFRECSILMLNFFLVDWKGLTDTSVIVKGHISCNHRKFIEESFRNSLFSEKP